MDASIVDPVQGYGVNVSEGGELKVSAAIPDPVTTTVSGTVDVNIASTTAPIETTPSAGSVDQDQVDVATTSGGTEIVKSGDRKGLLIANLHATETVYLGLGGAPTPSTGYPLPPGGTFAFPAGVSASVQVKGITTSATARVAFVEFT